MRSPHCMRSKGIARGFGPRLGSVLSLGIAAPVLAMTAISAGAAEVNATNDPSHVWGGPVLAVNPKNPDNIVLASVGIGATKACYSNAKTDPQSPCADMNVVSSNLGGNAAVTTRPIGMMNNVPGFVMATAWVSFDRGKTWKKSAEVREGGTVPVFPPDHYQGPALSDTVGLTVTRDGTFFLAWDAVHFANVRLFNDFGGIPFIKSANGGRSWSVPVLTGSGIDGGRLLTDLATGVVYTVGGGGGGRSPNTAGDPNFRVNRDATSPAPNPTGGGGGHAIVASANGGKHWNPPQRIGGAGTSVAAAHGMIATAFKTTGNPNFLANGRSPVNNDLCGTAPAPCTVFETSMDGGATWTRQVLSVPNTFRGQPVIAADPARAGYFAIAVLTNAATEFDVYRTRDSGKTWSGPTKCHRRWRQAARCPRDSIRTEGRAWHGVEDP